MNNNGHLIYQAERPLSRTEVRALDTARGEVARGLSRLFHSRNGCNAPRPSAGHAATPIMARC